MSLNGDMYRCFFQEVTEKLVGADWCMGECPCPKRGSGIELSSRQRSLWFRTHPMSFTTGNREPTLKSLLGWAILRKGKLQLLSCHLDFCAE